jgi:hypothetical protein
MDEKNIPERDWRLLRSLHRTALERYCSRVLDECAAVACSNGSAHERYGRLYRLLQDRDDDIAAAFNDLRRSTAVQRLAAMINLGVVTDADLSAFTSSTSEGAMALAEIVRSRRNNRRTPTA